MASIEVRGVGKSFGAGAPVLQEIDFTVADGEFVSLLGASGCGKSTLLRIVAGLESPDQGSVSIAGREVTALSPKDRDIAMVFQNYALYPHLNVLDNIGMGLKLRGVPAPETRARVEEAARMLGLSALLERKPAALSGGQRQRVALARALVRKPSAFLLDEPLSNLDAVLREKTRGELKLLFKRVRGSVIYVTHDQIEAMTLSDRIVVLDRGRVQQIGPPEEIYGRPSNVFVAGFLGSPPMNFLPRSALAAAGLVAGHDAGPKDLLCGVRPEDVRVSERGEAGLVEFPIALAEPTGAATILTFGLAGGGATLRAVVPASWKSAGPSAWIGLPADRMHFFDPDSQIRV